MAHSRGRAGGFSPDARNPGGRDVVLQGMYSHASRIARARGGASGGDTSAAGGGAGATWRGREAMGTSLRRGDACPLPPRRPPAGAPDEYGEVAHNHKRLREIYSARRAGGADDETVEAAARRSRAMQACRARRRAEEAAAHAYTLSHSSRRILEQGSARERRKNAHDPGVNPPPRLPRRRGGPRDAARISGAGVPRVDAGVAMDTTVGAHWGVGVTPAAAWERAGAEEAWSAAPSLLQRTALIASGDPAAHRYMEEGGGGGDREGGGWGTPGDAPVTARTASSDGGDGGYAPMGLARAPLPAAPWTAPQRHRGGYDGGVGGGGFVATPRTPDGVPLVTPARRLRFDGLDDGHASAAREQGAAAWAGADGGGAGAGEYSAAVGSGGVPRWPRAVPPARPATRVDPRGGGGGTRPSPAPRDTDGALGAAGDVDGAAALRDWVVDALVTGRVVTLEGLRRVCGEAAHVGATLGLGVRDIDVVLDWVAGEFDADV